MRCARVQRVVQGVTVGGVPCDVCCAALGAQVRMRGVTECAAGGGESVFHLQ